MQLSGFVFEEIITKKNVIKMVKTKKKDNTVLLFKRLDNILREISLTPLNGLIKEYRLYNITVIILRETKKEFDNRTIPY